MRNSILRYLAIGIFLILVFLVVRNWKNTTQITDSAMVAKITNMGKLELVKYTMKDIIEQKETHLILPDSKVSFLCVGEVTACLDLTKIREADILQTEDSVTVTLPEPEICYARIDHQRSRVYDLTGAWFPGNAKNMVEGVYKLAEQKLSANAQDMDLLGKARENAQTIFRPLLESISGKKVTLHFK